MKIPKISNILRKYFMITVATVIYAIGVSLFIEPNGIVPGGFTGVAMIISHFIPSLGTGTIILILNIPLIIAAIFVFGFRFLAPTIYAVALSSVLIDIFAQFDPITENLMLAALAGGFTMAVSLEIILREGATTGGTDVIVKLLRRKFKHLSAGKLFVITDGIIVALSALVFKDIEIALYAVICIIVYSTVIDMILYNRDEAKIIYIISDKYEAITDRLLNELDAGATFLEGVGAYSGAEKKVVLCVIKKRLAAKALKIIKSEDEASFAIVTTANEVFGEGYKIHGEQQI
ncbi:MAG: YitT family protein [Oscillospiraceae bacterium]|nr:YitT family protein [Oscillospiraceae bacterium]